MGFQSMASVCLQSQTVWQTSAFFSKTSGAGMLFIKARGDWFLPSWKKFSENFLKFTEIYLNHIWKIAYYHFVPLNQFWTHFSNIAELSEKSELFWICLKNLNCFENCWNSLNSICIVLKQSELFWILLKQSELFWMLLKQSELF